MIDCKLSCFYETAILTFPISMLRSELAEDIDRSSSMRCFKYRSGIDANLPADSAQCVRWFYAGLPAHCQKRKEKGRAHSFQCLTMAFVESTSVPSMSKRSPDIVSTIGGDVKAWLSPSSSSIGVEALQVGVLKPETAITG